MMTCYILRFWTGRGFLGNKTSDWVCSGTNLRYRMIRLGYNGWDTNGRA